MSNKYSLIVLSPMPNEQSAVHALVEDLGYTSQDMEQLTKDKKIFFMQTGMGAVNMLNAIYTAASYFAYDEVDVLLTGFAGALSPNLHIGSACQMACLTHFSFVEFQGAGDFEIIQTPAAYHDDFLTFPKTEHGENDAPALPHVRLNPTDLGAKKHYNLISVPALLQGQGTKAYLCAKGLHVVDMEGFALASALYHVKNTQHDAQATGQEEQHISPTRPAIGLDIIKVITDCPKEKFEFAKLHEYSAHLQQCELLQMALKKKFARF